MWKTYEVELQFTSPFASSIPQNPKDIESMLIARAPSQEVLERRKEAGEEITPLPELIEQVSEEVGAEPGIERGYATFKRDEDGIYYEARCVKAHLKDCANILATRLKVKALKAKLANRVYVEPEKIRLKRNGEIITEPDGNELRIVHAMTLRGPRSSLKRIDFVENATISFYLKVLDDGIIDEKLLRDIFEYGGVHGMGQDRSLDWGRYQLVKFKEIS